MQPEKHHSDVYFQQALGDIVFVELPEKGRTYDKDGKTTKFETGENRFRDKCSTEIPRATN